MSDELKPCPFCGFERPHFMEEGHWIYMACESCGCGGPVSTQMRDPSDNWNTRPLEDALRAELAAARAEAEKYRPIPVSERMPKYFDEVLFYDNIADTWTMGYLNKGQWTAIDMLYWHGKDFKRITHWMPLPPAPEVEP